MKMKVEIYLIKLLLLSQIVNTLVLVLILYSGSDYEDSPKAVNYEIPFSIKNTYDIIQEAP